MNLFLISALAHTKLVAVKVTTGIMYQIQPGPLCILCNTLFPHHSKRHNTINCKHPSITFKKNNTTI